MRLALATIAIAIAIAIAFAFASSACVLPPAPFANKKCDDAHACAAPSTCVDGTCVVVADGGEGEGATEGEGEGEGVGEGEGEGVGEGEGEGAGEGEGEGEGEGAGEGEGVVGEGEGAAGEGEGEGDTVCFGNPQQCASAGDVVTVCDSAATDCSAFTTALVRTISEGVAIGLQRAVTIFVPAGDYAEAVHVGTGATNAITIAGETGSHLSGGGASALLVDGVGANVTVTGVEMSTFSTVIVVSARNETTTTLIRCDIHSGTIGIDSGDASTVVVDACLIHENGRRDNSTAGGARFRGPTSITNTVFRANGIDQNGSHGSGFGAVQLLGNVATTTFRFNTLFQNDAQGDGGIFCANPIVIDSTIEADGDPINGNCDVHFSEISGFGGFNDNISANPLILDDLGHVDLASPVRGAGNPDTGGIVHDFDLEPRPDANGGPDIGADELQ